MKKLMKMKAKAFTLVEMLVVLLVISVLLLLFVPNLSKQKEAVHEKGNAAVVKVVEGQAELYTLQHSGEVSVAKLVEEEMISEEQAEAYNEYFAKNTGQSRTVNP
ncbi:competence type IV pilus major pilin ComGC [Streptococcus marmotae]|uniref:competence type IV pilus major pilin ComGC n=1 Tax=Streptococcus marmotae TaxID=1825069 RepID=UPI0008336BD6|nr:competence type IV pilus major pilin ComGC [Streptococcus marmotae]